MQRPSEHHPQGITPNYTYTNLADDLALVLTTGPQAHARLAAILEPWPEDSAPAAPPKQPHPIFDHIDDPEPEENMGQWIERRAREQRAPFMPMWGEAIARVKAKEFTKQADLALAYKKPIAWAANFRKAVVKQGVMSEPEWWSHFPRRLKNGSTKPSTYDPQLTARKPAGVGGTPQCSRATFEKVMQEQRKLDFDTVIQMIRFRCWATTHDICEHFHQTPAWAASLRAFVIREGLFTAESWVKCFGKDNRK